VDHVSIQSAAVDLAMEPLGGSVLFPLGLACLRRTGCWRGCRLAGFEGVGCVVARDALECRVAAQATTTKKPMTR
jgi:hypothetical protein